MRQQLCLRSLLILLSLVHASCGGIWNSFFGSDENSVSGADGGTAPMCVRDSRDILLASLNRTCNRSADCPAGAFCDIDVGGFCNFQCMDTVECPSNQTCNCFGQCVGSSGTDAGPPLDPACPKDLTLIQDPGTLTRSCKHDDTCPYGTFCSTQTGLCAADCISDSQCVTPDGGAPLRCDCFGRCIGQGGTGPRPQRRLPQINATPGEIHVPGASDRPWTHQIEVSVFTTDIDLTTTQALDATGEMIRLPLTTPIDVALPPGVDATCSVDTEGHPIFDQAHHCTRLPANGATWQFDPVSSGYRATTQIWLRHTPVPGAAPVSKWAIHFTSNSLDRSPAIVEANLSGEPLAPAGEWVDGFTSASTAGAGYSGFVTFTPPSQASDPAGALGDSADVHVPVRAWVTSTGLLLFDDAHAFTAAGQIPVRTDGPTDISWLDITPELSPVFNNAVSGNIRATTTLLDTHYKTNTGSMLGTLDVALDLNNSLSHFGLRYRLSPDPSVNCADVGACPQTWKPWDGTGIKGSTLDTSSADSIFLALDGMPLTVESVLCSNRFDAFERNIARFNDPALFGHFLPTVLSFSGDLLCRGADMNNPTVDSLPDALGLFSYQDRVEREQLDPPATSADLLSSCLDDLDHPERRTSSSCWNYFRFNNAIFYARGSLRDPLGSTMTENGHTFSLNASRLLHRMMQQWLALHSFVASQGLQEWDLHQVLSSASTSAASDSPSLAADPAALLRRMETGWAYVLFSAVSILFPGDEDHADQTAPGFLSIPDEVLRSPDYRVDYLPASDPALSPSFALTRGHDQAIGLPANLLETLSWHFKLLDRYLEDASVQAYLASVNGGSPTLKTAALTKLGTTLAYGAAVEAIATRMYAAAATAPVPWKARWDIARNELSALRSRVVARGTQLASGNNPLGIADDDTPIFFGDPMSTDSRFFASSDYLMNTWAISAVASAQGALGQARDAWMSSRNSQIQSSMTQTDRDRRMQDLQSRYGQTLIDNCGIVGKKSWEVLDSISDEQFINNCFVDPNPVLACSTSGTLPATLPIDPAKFRDDLLKKWNTDATVDPQMRLCLINRLGLTVKTTKQLEECAKTYTTYSSTGSGDPMAPPKPRSSEQACTDATKAKCCKMKSVDTYTTKPLDSVTDTRELLTAYNQCQDELGVSNDIMPGTGLNRECFRGRIGAQVMENVGALQDIFVAKFQWRQQQREYRLQADNCLAVEKAQGTIKRKTADFESTTLKWDQARYAFDQAANALQTAASAVGGVSITAPGSGAAAALEIAAGVARALSIDASKHLEDARTHYNAFMTTIQANEEIRKCWVDAERVKLGIDSASLQVARRQTDLNSGVIVLADLIRQTKQAYNEGRTAVAREEGRYVSTVAHHYWLGEKVDRFHREFDWGKRLTYLAMRAVEYEFQQTFPLREQILSSFHPDQLEQAIRLLQQELATRTINRRRPDDAAAVLSLREDILGLTDRLNVPPGERAWSAAQRFKGRLWDPTYALYDEAGRWLGQGIPFNLTPQGVLKARCAERLWRVTATIQGDALSSTAPAASLLLLKNNTFSSQWCPGHGSGTQAQVASVQPSRQLFRPGSDSDPIGEQNRYVSALMTPFFNIRRSDFYRSEFQEGASDELAGRGLYGDYILLFPKELLEGPASLVKDSGVVREKFPLDRVEDVLLRFDYLSVDGLPNLSQ